MMKSFDLWLEKAQDDLDLIKELEEVKGDTDKINDMFYKELEFGTAGLRGIMGAGTNRMNIYMVRKATQGLSDYINKKYKEKSVAISFDSRNKSELFAKEAAKVLAGNGIKVFLTNELKPTPVLSYLVRRLSCQAGIMITASHNPAKYNGYKCYGDDGCQMTEVDASEVYENMKKIDIFNGIKTKSFEESIDDGNINYVPEEIYNEYIEEVYKNSINKDACIENNISIVYTPLNGAGNKPVRQIMNRIGIRDENIHIVKEQERPDGNFTTCEYPNPEMKEALKLSLELARQVKPDIVLATDPDSDRIAVSVKHNDNFITLSGNEFGILLTNYILSMRENNNTLPSDAIIVKTIVSSEMIKSIAKKYNCKVIDVLTGFKYIGEQIGLLERNNAEDKFLLGFEESCGYLVGTYVRDKDAVVASMLACEMTAYYKKENKTLIDILNNLYEEYGYYKSSNLNISFEGESGMKKMQDIMDRMRNDNIDSIGDVKVTKSSDYLNSIETDLDTKEKTKISLPKSNVLSYELTNGCKVIVRPSGTEPKIKVYITSVGNDLKSTEENSNILSEYMSNLIK